MAVRPCLLDRAFWIVPTGPQHPLALPNPLLGLYLSPPASQHGSTTQKWWMHSLLVKKSWVRQFFLQSSELAISNFHVAMLPAAASHQPPAACRLPARRRASSPPATAPAPAFLTPCYQQPAIRSQQSRPGSNQSNGASNKFSFARELYCWQACKTET